MCEGNLLQNSQARARPRHRSRDENEKEREIELAAVLNSSSNKSLLGHIDKDEKSLIKGETEAAAVCWLQFEGDASLLSLGLLFDKRKEGMLLSTHAE